MNLFKCQSCGQVLYFENTHCERCQHRLGYIPALGTLSALEPAGGENWTALADQGGRQYRFCDNAEHDVCNWLVEADSPERFCAACRHNHTIPDLSVDDNLTRWRKLEYAKHRLFYTLIKLGLPTQNRIDDPQHGLEFDFKGDPVDGGPHVMTGHDEGIITIALKESDDAEREKMREEMGEYYRTVLGHFRHEVGHYYWDVLVRDGGHLDSCRQVFGDDRLDYNQALQDRYANGVPPDWQENFVSAYASVHPWEDFAETWAHYLHIIDTVETAGAFGISIDPKIADTDALSTEVDFEPHKAKNFQKVIDAWLPLTFAVNSLNRSMGLADMYPFVLSPAVVHKLGYIHDLVHGQVQN
ncbi:putative zinc-binding peptidase [Roseomonas sp. NAR14]|uniref:Zinc-binding peptidase n=1 Tax=Roseomonas acroporae TaxID=2937791 RepID=A0A9X1YE75_9PROT|nr:putative zinc-binding peptidase [Roseomonas acroporae]MCK8787493.1 putative zinc-binding peptidase [Roseomonas acroporae]